LKHDARGGGVIRAREKGPVVGGDSQNQEGQREKKQHINEGEGDLSQRKSGKTRGPPRKIYLKKPGSDEARRVHRRNIGGGQRIHKRKGFSEGVKGGTKEDKNKERKKTTLRIVQHRGSVRAMTGV